MSTQPSTLKRCVALATATIAIGLTIVVASGLAHAEDGDTAPAADTAAGAVVAIDAAPLWAKNCQSCHGADGKAATKIGKMKKVKDLTAADVRAGFDRQRMLDSVSKGMEDAAGKVLMKPYSEKLSADEIVALVDYVFALPH